MLGARYSHLYFCQSLNRLQRVLSAIAELLVILPLVVSLLQSDIRHCHRSVMSKTTTPNRVVKSWHCNNTEHCDSRSESWTPVTQTAGLKLPPHPS